MLADQATGNLADKLVEKLTASPANPDKLVSQARPATQTARATPLARSGIDQTAPTIIRATRTTEPQRISARSSISSRTCGAGWLLVRCLASEAR